MPPPRWRISDSAPLAPLFDFPEPLFEAQLHERKICLVCAKKPAETVLRSASTEVVPLCPDCSAAWNVHGYQILKHIKPGLLLRRLALFKLKHPLQRPSLRTLRRDLDAFQQWARKMKRWTREK